MELKELEAELGRVRRKAQDWATSRVQQVSDCTDQHKAFIRDQTEKAKELTGHKLHLEQVAEQTRQRLHDESHELLGLQSTHTVVAHTTSAAQQSLISARDTLEQDREQYRRRMADLEAGQRRRQKKLDALVKSIALFGDRLGMQLKPGKELEVVFSCIDYHEPDKEFSFAVKVQDDDRYTVVTCSPAVPDLDELSAALNATNDFAAFTKAMRSRFVQLARQAHGLQ